MRSFDALDEWLAEATQGFCPDAKERIATEIGAHVREAVADLMDEGLSEREAVAKAVASLGNPRKARRSFGHTHFTEREMQLLEWIAKPRPRIWTTPVLLVPVYLAWIPFLIIGLILGIQKQSMGWLLGTAVGTVLVGLAAVGVREAYGRFWRMNPVRILILMALGDLISSGFFWSYFLFIPLIALAEGSHVWWLAGIVAIMAALTGFAVFQIRRANRRSEKMNPTTRFILYGIALFSFSDEFIVPVSATAIIIWSPYFLLRLAWKLSKASLPVAETSGPRPA
jgi:hypothetical protein